MTHSYVCHDSFVCVPWLSDMCDVTLLSVWHDSFTPVGSTPPNKCWLFAMASTCAMTHADVWHGSFVCHDSCIRMTRLIHAYVSFMHMAHSYAYVWHNLCDTTHPSVCHGSFIRMTRLIHAYVWHYPFICVPWLIHTSELNVFKQMHLVLYGLDLCHASFVCVTWLIHMCDMTHLYVWHDSFICVTWLICMCDMTHSYVSHDLFVCVTWLIHMCDMTHSYV